MNNCLDVLFLGDIVGRPGRKAVAKFISDLNKDNSFFLKTETLQGFKKRPDFIIANVENASHGFGLTERNYNELSSLGIDAFTSGNHVWDKKEIFSYIDNADKLIRPLNYPEGTPGVGSNVFYVNNTAIGVINVLGRVFMNPIDSPWTALENEIEKLKDKTSIIIVDFHAEATAEKVSFGYFANNLGVSAMIGTHTHIQTSDEKIIADKMGYITDVGYCGAYSSIIGMEIDCSIKRLITGLPDKYQVASMGKAEVDGVRMLISSETGFMKRIERFRYCCEVDDEVNDS